MRVIRHAQLVVAAGADESPSFDVTDGVFGMLSMEEIESTVLTPMVKIGKDNNWKEVKDSAGNTITMAVSGNHATRIPDGCFPCCKMKFVFDQTEVSGAILNVVTSS